MTYDHPNENPRDDPDHDEREIIEIATGVAPPCASRTATRRLIAQRRLLVRGIHLPYAPQEELDGALDEIRYGAAELRAAGLPQPAVHLLAPSFSGKTSQAKEYVRRVTALEEHPQGTMPVVYAKLDTDGTVGSLATDILRALGERRPSGLTPDKRWERARQAIREKGVSLLILDEFQRAGRRPTISPVIAGKILDIMDDGDCALGFLGKTEARNVFDACSDLKNRLDTPVRIPRLKWTTDSETFIAFADAFDDALVAAGVTDLKSRFADPGIAQLLLESANGLIGQFSRIVETAVIAMTRDGHRAITRQDLADAVQDWSIGNERIGYNPFDQPAPSERTEKTAASQSLNDDEGLGEDDDGMDR